MLKKLLGFFKSKNKNNSQAAQTSPASDIAQGMQIINPNNNKTPPNTTQIRTPTKPTKPNKVGKQTNKTSTSSHETHQVTQTQKTKHKLDPVDEARMLNLLKNAEHQKDLITAQTRKRQQQHTKIPVYTGNPFSIGDCDECEQKLAEIAKKEQSKNK